MSEALPEKNEGLKKLQRLFAHREWKKKFHLFLRTTTGLQGMAYYDVLITQSNQRKFGKFIELVNQSAYWKTVK